MIFRLLLVLGLLLYSLIGIVQAKSSEDEANLTVTHYQSQARYQYGLKILELALSKLEIPFKIQSVDYPDLNEARGERMVEKGELDLEFMSTNADRESKLLAVKIPIYRGILGLRLMLVSKDKQEEMQNISSIEDLRHYVGGHGTHWGDLPVYEANSLKVVTSAQYETLFTLLKHNRFDYFHRGINEVWDEVLRHSDQLVVADKVMLFYPHPVYFFVSRKRPELAEAIEKGLKLAIEDGSFKRLFLEEAKPFIDRAELESRKLIILKNPVIPPGTPPLETSWWLPEKFQLQLKDFPLIQ
ncbi:hypothetical protein BTA51_11770 [Hahella sp. CCB-MM4]|uniref:substrate-binding periplasmic protein n=1 Tax=Hahella sp. (strain CCB-MM4) TaxID=1926491 RepID=UPI000B9A4631|nr:transporter substrate-binding domain-containing protein [Hahella sp. CCB-MM4]OZG73163.1 hypothetical protein BTA51_11770 [Hahella sp. CCB-MM4]